MWSLSLHAFCNFFWEQNLFNFLFPRQKLEKKHCDGYNFLLHNLSEILTDPSPTFSIHRPCHDKLKVLILGICALSEHFYIFQPLSPFWIHLPQNKVIKNVSLDLILFFFVFLGVKFALFLFKCNAMSFLLVNFSLQFLWVTWPTIANNSLLEIQLQR